MKKYFNLKNQFIVLSIVLMFTIIIGLVASYANPDETVTANTDFKTIFSSNSDIKRIADTSTVDSYKQLFTSQDKYDGRVWTDKSVYSYDDTKGSITIDNISINFNADFLNVFSVLAANQTDEKNIVPTDIQLAIDITNSMLTGTPGNDKDHLTKVLKSANALIQKIKEGIPNSRIGVIFYGGSAYQAIPINEGLIEFELKYTKSKSVDNYDVPVITYTITDYNTQKVISKVTYDTGKGTNKLVEGKFLEGVKESNEVFATGTNYQAAVIASLKNLADNPNKTYTTPDGTVLKKIPTLILLGDGEANSFFPDSDDSDVVNGITWDNAASDVTTSGNWWKAYEQAVIPIRSENKSVAILKTTMNASYWKNIVAKAYDVPVNTVQIYTIGFAAGAKTPFLDPKDSIVESKDAGQKKIYDSFLELKNGTTKTLTYTTPANGTINKNYKLLGRPKTEYKINQLQENEYQITMNDIDINYPTKYYTATVDNIDQVFNEIYDSLTTYTYIESPIKENTSLKYSDEIGNNLEIKNITNLTLFGKSYNITKREATSTEKTNQKSGITYTYYEVENGSNNIINHGYDEYMSDGRTISTNTFKLNSLKIWVEMNNSTGIQTLNVEIPNKVIPVLNVHYQIADDGTITYKTNENTENSLPIRIFYTVGVKNNYIDKYAKFNLDLVSKDYITKNLVNKNSKEYVYFYSNLYDNSHNYGNATATYTISDKNSHYLNQDYLVLYKTSKNGDNNGEGLLKETGGNVVLSDKITKLENIDKSAIYYYIREYYTKGEGNKANLNKYATAIEGSKLNLVYYDEETKKEVNEEGKNIVVANKIGTTKENNLNSRTNKTNNVTETASITLSSNYNNKNITDYLGNNGRLEIVNNRNIELRKEVTGTAGDKNKEWTFQIILTPKNGITLNTSYSYKGESFIDGVTKPSDGTITFSKQSNGSYIGTVKLKHGQSVIIMDIEEGTSYEINEVNANTDNYNLKATNNKTTLTTDKIVEMQNVKGIDLPKTGGGNSNIVQYIAGILFIIWGITTFLLIYKRKKTNNN